jgi:hypothetical protein
MKMSNSTKSSMSEVELVAAKLAVVWTGTIFGMKVSDLVLLATLIYTVLQIGLLLWDRVIKPIWFSTKSVTDKE